MASTFGVAGPLAGFDEKGLEKVKRSRLSLHMKTRRVRRWLLVQLVSVPVAEEQEQDEPKVASAQQQERLDHALNSLTFEKMLMHQTRTWI